MESKNRAALADSESDLGSNAIGPMGLPKLATQCNRAGQNVCYLGVEISGMKVALPMLFIEKTRQQTSQRCLTFLFPTKVVVLDCQKLERF